MINNISSRTLFNDFYNQLIPYYGGTEARSIGFLIFESLVNLSKSEILANKHLEMTDNLAYCLKNVLERLRNHEPVQYVLGWTEFYGCKILVNPSVLIPRQETEELVDYILKDIKEFKNPNVLDICTGSGCIAIALKKNMQANVFALDISSDALQTAIKNASENKTDVNFIQTDVLTGELPSSLPAFDIIVSNPPYVTEGEKNLMDKNVLSFEPPIALFVEDQNPLIFYKRITGLASKILKEGGKLYFEINERFGKEIRELMVSLSFTEVQVLKDLNGKERMVSGYLKKQ